MILSCRIHTQAAGRAWVAALPVSIEEWGLFVRTREYFNDAHWEGGRFAGASGGDAALTAVGFAWVRRHARVGAVTYCEAQAYCTSRGGRLPWLQECRSLDAAFQCLDRGQVDRMAAWLPEDRRTEFWRPVGHPEWCGDWFNATADGPDVRAEGPLRRRITADPWCMVSTSRNPHLGFRVAYPRVLGAYGSDVAGWEWIEPPTAEASALSDARHGRGTDLRQQRTR